METLKKIIISMANDMAGPTDWLKALVKYYNSTATDKIDDLVFKNIDEKKCTYTFLNFKRPVSLQFLEERVVKLESALERRLKQLNEIEDSINNLEKRVDDKLLNNFGRQFVQLGDKNND